MVFGLSPFPGVLTWLPLAPDVSLILSLELFFHFAMLVDLVVFARHRLQTAVAALLLGLFWTIITFNQIIRTYTETFMPADDTLDFGTVVALFAPLFCGDCNVIGPTTDPSGNRPCQGRYSPPPLYIDRPNPSNCP